MNPKAALARGGQNLRQMREEKRLSVEALAALSGTSDEMVRQFEAGNGGDLAVADLLQIAEILDTDIRNILGGKMGK